MNSLVFFLPLAGLAALLAVFATHSQFRPIRAKMVTALGLTWLNRKPAYLPSPQQTPNNDLLELPAVLPPAPKLGEAEILNNLDTERLLADPLDRISAEFHVPPAMAKRVRFWFDVYTRHGRTTHVIHHSRYPWIVFEILDFSAAVREGTGPEWLRVERAESIVKQRRIEIRNSLLRLAANGAKPRNDFDRHLLDLLREIPGKRVTVVKAAAAAVRSQLGQRDYFISGLRRSSRYLPFLEERFFAAGLPLDLTRMPFVESSFNERAESKVGASGIWQIMPATGRAYGIVSDQIDERNSPFKSTDMAARLLRSYHRALGSWPLAVTSYNHGIGNIQRAINAAKSRDLPTIIDRYHEGDFRFASSNFYACFLAALFAERYSDVVFPSVARESALAHERFVITRPVTLTQLIAGGGLDVRKVFEHNLDLDRKAWKSIRLPRGYVLHLPPGSRDLLPRRYRDRLREMRETPQPTRVSENPASDATSG